jgi:chemotaxis protein histidine kinase CheA
MLPMPPPEVIHMPNRLIGKAGAFRAGEAAIAAAEAAASAVSLKFPSLVNEETARLLTCWAGIRGRETPDTAPLGEMRRIAHDLKGQGTTMGWPLVSAIARSLSAILAEGAAGPHVTAAIDTHLAALQAVVGAGMRDETTPAAIELVRGLEKVSRRAAGAGRPT